MGVYTLSSRVVRLPLVLTQLICERMGVLQLDARTLADMPEALSLVLTICQSVENINLP